MISSWYAKGENAMKAVSTIMSVGEVSTVSIFVQTISSHPQTFFHSISIENFLFCCMTKNQRRDKVIWCRIITETVLSTTVSGAEWDYGRESQITTFVELLIFKMFTLWIMMILWIFFSYSHALNNSIWVYHIV